MARDGGAETLDRIALLRAMAPEARRALAGRCRWQHYPAGQQIVGQLDLTREVYLLAEGRARAISYSLAGKEVSYRDIETGDMFGEIAAIDGEPRSADVVALDDCLVARMSESVFWELLEHHPEVVAATLKRLTSLVRALTARVFEFSTLAVNNRIHAELLRLARGHQGDGNTALIEPAPTHFELANRLSTHREAVTRELNVLVRRGLVERDGNALRVIDVAELSRMVELVLGEQH